MKVGGKFFYSGSQKLYVKGATYGTFREHGGEQLPPPNVVSTDFAAMAAHGLNSVRTYTVPPIWLLDLAAEHGLRVLVGIPWTQHVTFLDSQRTRGAIEVSVRDGVRACHRHPAVLGYVIGNEIPPGIVRWHGRQAVERFIERLYRTAKAQDPEALVTYANYPSTEYLHLPFLDFVSFNVFLEDRHTLERYVARLHTLAGDRPLVISELGLDSIRNGVDEQASSIAMQVAATFAAGCAGSFVFAWSDEWCRGGVDVEDWEFGVVDRQRRPKPALHTLKSTYARVPFVDQLASPRASVVVCTYNGSRTIAGCVDAIRRLDYPDFEVIVVDDGSTDGAGAIAGDHGARVIRTTNRGLSAARNTGAAASDGKIIAFCDDDAEPDPQWLGYLVRTLITGSHDGAGGPNVPPAGSLIGDSVGHAPGGPIYVLASPTIAEHIPGCNMAFWREAIDRVGGFDERFRQAGDDVDICWRIQAAGGTLGFAPGAVVWHHPRQSVTAYVRQQIGYGRAEALLERKWPERYNGRGHVDWRGSVYGGKARRTFSRRRWHVYYGRSGNGPFQSVYSRRSEAPFPVAPEWYLLIALLAAATVLPLVGEPALPTFTVFGVAPSAFVLALGVLALGASAASWTAAVVLGPSMPLWRRTGLRALIFLHCLVQPLARLYGRTHRGLTPWRMRGPSVSALPAQRSASWWSEAGFTPEEWLHRLEHSLVHRGAQVTSSSGFETWDLRVQVGPLACARARLAVEEHGAGRQMVRLKIRPRPATSSALCAATLAALTASAFVLGSTIAGAALGCGLLWLVLRTAHQAGVAATLPVSALRSLEQFKPVPDVRSVPIFSVPPKIAVASPVRRKLELSHLPRLDHATSSETRSEAL